MDGGEENRRIGDAFVPPAAGSRQAAPPRPDAAPANHGSVTITTSEAPPAEGGPVLVLRKQDDGDAKESTPDERPHVEWTEDTVDNEFMGKKSSKSCCIFHKKRAFGESSSESGVDDSSSSSEGGPRRGAPKRKHKHKAHAHDCDCE